MTYQEPVRLRHGYEVSAIEAPLRMLWQFLNLISTASKEILGKLRSQLAPVSIENTLQTLKGVYGTTPDTRTVCLNAAYVPQ